MQSLTVNWNIVSSTSDRAAVLCQKFQQQYSAFPPVTSRFISKNDSSGHFEFKDTSSIEVLTALRKLPSGKSVRLDLVSNELLKLCACSAVCSSLATLFNMSLLQGSFPAVWKSAIITPILKAGKNASLPQSYRPVALLSCLSKVLERFVHEQLSSFLLESRALPDEQFGFLRGRSAEWQVLSVVERWHKALDQRHLVHAAAKAFDRVDHRLLLQSFYSLGVRGMSLQRLQSYLSAWFIRVRVMDTLSAAASITSGVPQGSVLGPSLFLVQLRGIPEAMSPSQASLFADDTMAFQENCSGEQTSPCCDLGNHLGNLSSWAASYNVDFNAAKSADLLVGSKPPPSACLFMNGTAIPRVQRHVHLGITITSDLRWNDHVATVLKKVAPALHLSLTLAYRHQLPRAVIRKFYVAFMRPRME